MLPYIEFMLIRMFLTKISYFLGGRGELFYLDTRLGGILLSQ